VAHSIDENAELILSFGYCGFFHEARIAIREEAIKRWLLSNVLVTTALTAVEGMWVSGHPERQGLLQLARRVEAPRERD